MLPHCPMTAGPSHRGPAHDLVPWMLVLLMHVAHRELSAHPYVAEHTGDTHRQRCYIPDAHVATTIGQLSEHDSCGVVSGSPQPLKDGTRTT
jgi:hypothetical protein